MNDARMSIGQLARAAGITSRVVRYYHREGLLAEPVRSAADHRDYSESDLEQVLRIVCLRREGLAVAEVEVALRSPTPEDVERLHEGAVKVGQAAERLRQTRESVVSQALGHTKTETPATTDPQTGAKQL